MNDTKELFREFVATNFLASLAAEKRKPVEASDLDVLDVARFAMEQTSYMGMMVIGMLLAEANPRLAKAFVDAVYEGAEDIMAKARTGVDIYAAEIAEKVLEPEPLDYLWRS